MIATPQKAADEPGGARELALQVAALREEVRALSARLESCESNLEDLYDKLGYEYADGSGEPPAARRGRTG